MDTYFYTNCNCVKCGRCVLACQSEGRNFLVGVRDDCPYEKSDYVPCHHWEGFMEDKTPCQLACHYNAIKLSRS